MMRTTRIGGRQAGFPARWYALQARGTYGRRGMQSVKEVVEELVRKGRTARPAMVAVDEAARTLTINLTEGEEYEVIVRVRSKRDTGATVERVCGVLVKSVRHSSAVVVARASGVGGDHVEVRKYDRHRVVDSQGYEETRNPQRGPALVFRAQAVTAESKRERRGRGDGFEEREVTTDQVEVERGEGGAAGCGVEAGVTGGAA